MSEFVELPSWFMAPQQVRVADIQCIIPRVGNGEDDNWCVLTMRGGAIVEVTASSVDILARIAAHKASPTAAPAD